MTIVLSSPVQRTITNDHCAESVTLNATVWRSNQPHAV
jgi:hypothetical protein